MYDIDEENNDIEGLTPWIFQHTQILDHESFGAWPKERTEFRDVFYLLNTQFHDACEAGELVDALEPTETVSLPRKNWKAPRREYFTHSMRSQGMLLRILMETIYYNLRDIVDDGPELQSVTHHPRLLCWPNISQAFLFQSSGKNTLLVVIDSPVVLMEQLLSVYQKRVYR
ncbi:uncharacterized protein BO80DRAFT_432971 [Aspergillus ibericus CBS 121593]|uniref:Uncharacterized protein n=1 Tax=Aspergillus ibericus CBS 121593 TaxID=1448316 RepID=A0A395H5N8_9EURO|nr:hypothetical protein BO80DRAFT_432971 [Aspergillus ibericus CBS 121593]RAL03191.1 hypothetical protein BO80DRAFT_432971 [Aspergillus ibericus CBS 121593]